jgi:hypothetical protein
MDKRKKNRQKWIVFLRRSWYYQGTRRKGTKALQDRDEKAFKGMKS